MEILDLFVRIAAKDEASSEIEDISQNIVGKLAGAAKTAAKALAGLWAVKKVYDFGKAAYSAYAQFEQLEGGIAKLYGNAGMSLDEYLESMKESGKSVDELTEAYQRNERAQQAMMKNASEAWKTAGMDANSYMETATSFSAALINSLGGDTERAAELTDRAMTAISDNYNTFGSDMESVKNAFMGFSKQNYTMLDNLKLGYGGTKAEMERLIADANEWGAANGEAANLSIDSFADVVTAIEQIQKKQGIYGTTQREALNTIEGSTNAFRASWKNLVAEMGKPDADLVARVSDMFTALFGEGGEGGLVRNVAKEVGVIGTNMVNALKTSITTAVDWLYENGGKIVNDGIRAFIDKAKRLTKTLKIDPPNIVESFGKMFEKTGKLQKKLESFIGDVAENLREWGPDIAEAASGLWDAIVKAAEDNSDAIRAKAGEILGNIADWILENLPKMQEKLNEFMGKLFVWVTEQLESKAPAALSNGLSNLLTFLVEVIEKYGPKVAEAFGQLIVNAATAIIKYGPTILANLVSLLVQLVSTVISYIPKFLSAAGQFMMGFLKGLKEKWPEISKWLSTVPKMVSDSIGPVLETLRQKGKDFLDGLKKGVEDKWAEVKLWFSELPSRIIDAIGNVVSTLIQKGKDFLSGLKDGVIEKWNDVKDWFSKLPSKAKDAIGDLASTLWQKGRDLLQGFWDGLTSIWGEISSWLTAKVNWANNQTSAAGAGGGFSGGGGGGYGDEGGGGAFGAFTEASRTSPNVAGYGGPQINIYLQYDAGADATDMVYGIADGLKLVLGSV